MVQVITADIGVDEFSKDLIRGLLIFLLLLQNFVEGCKTYRKSLAEKPKSLSTPTKKKKQLRSLKQRVSVVYITMHYAVTSVVYVIQSYERRSRALKTTSEKEKKYWSHITPEMMSDEEKVGDNMFVTPHLIEVKSSISLLKGLITVLKRCRPIMLAMQGF